LNSVSAARLSKDPVEKLRLSRVALQNNGAALVHIRTGLKRSIARRSPLDLMLDPANARLRRLADLLDLESDVRAADGDWNGAASSCLDALELGIASTNGGVWSDTFNGIEGPARKKLKELVPRLDAATLQTAANRLQSIEKRRIPLLDLWRNEMQMWRAHFLVEEPLWDEKSLREAAFSSKERARIVKMTRPEFIDHLTRRYEALMRRSSSNYRTFRDTPLRSFDPYTDKYVPAIAPINYLFHYRNQQTQNLLLRHALELEAIHRATSAYPASFATEIDPFDGERPLIYRRTDDTYQLYSIGPDTKDDGGAAISTVETDKETGFQSTTTRLRENSVGDILAPAFK
jgi:hypothetical protein